MLSKTSTNELQSPGNSPAAPSLSNVWWSGFGEMDRLFDRLFHGFDQTLAAKGWRAPIAVWEDEQNFYVEVELAGVPLEAIDVSVHERQLLLAYERQLPAGREFTYNERPYGRFERRLALPKTVDVDSIQAEMRQGVLHLTLAKMREAQPRKIAIQAG